MSSSTPKTILLRGLPMALERKAHSSGAITPGMLLNLMSTGLVQPHGTAGGKAVAYVAREEEYVGGALDDAYAVSDNIPFWVGQPGDQFYMLLEAGANVAAAAYLESNGAGSLQALSTAGTPLFRALEAVDNSAGGSPVRIRVEVL